MCVSMSLHVSASFAKMNIIILEPSNIWYKTCVIGTKGGLMYRVDLCTGRTYVQGGLMYRADLCTGQTYVQGGLMYRADLCTGWTYVQGGLMYRVDIS